MKKNLSDSSRMLLESHQGDMDSLNRLLEAHLPWITAQVKRRMGPVLQKKAETGDYVQNALLQFLKYGPCFSISSENQFRAFLLKVVENSLRNQHDWFTAARREIARERPLPSDTVLSLDPPQGEVKTPSKQAARHEQEAWIRLSMEFIDAKAREILVLRQWEKLPFKEIGDRLGVSEVAARMKHNRAVKQLSKKVWALRSGQLSHILE